MTNQFDEEGDAAKDELDLDGGIDSADAKRSGGDVELKGKSGGDVEAQEEWRRRRGQRAGQERWGRRGRWRPEESGGDVE